MCTSVRAVRLKAATAVAAGSDAAAGVSAAPGGRDRRNWRQKARRHLSHREISAQNLMRINGTVSGGGG